MTLAQATRGDGENQVGPHDFVPLRRWRNRHRCRHCLLTEALHPLDGWTESRSYGDRSEARDVDWHAYWRVARDEAVKRKQQVENLMAENADLRRQLPDSSGSVREQTQNTDDE